MDLKKRSEMLEKAKEMLSEKSETENAHKSGKKTAYELMNILFDEGTFVENGAYIKACAENAGFSDTSKYEGVVCGYGAIDGRLVFAYAQDVSRINGAFSKAASDKIVNLYELARKNGAPVISMFDSIGAKIAEGIDVLSGYGKVMKASAKLKGIIPQISIIFGEACGANALIASMADVCVMTERAQFSLSPVNVLKSAGAKENIGSADFNAKKGYVSDTAKDENDAVERVKRILSFLPSNKLDRNVYFGEKDNANRETPEIAEISANPEFDAHDIIKALADAGIYKELQCEHAKAMITAFAAINGIPCGIVANNPSENKGMICAGGAGKAARFIKLCDSFGLPVLTLVATNGFNDECEAKGKPASESVSALASVYAKAKIPLVTVNIGEAYGSAFTVMGSKALGADVVYALEGAKIGVLTPPSAVAMLWSERLYGENAPIEKRKELESEWELYMSTPLLAANAGAADDIIPYALVRAKVASALEMLSMKNEFVNL